MGEEDDKKDELDVMKIRVEGTRKSGRNRKQPQLYGYFFSTDQIQQDSDDEVEEISISGN